MRRKAIVFLLLISVSTTVLFSGCNGNTSSDTTANATQPSDSETESQTETQTETPPETESAGVHVDPVTISITAIGDMLMHAGASMPAVQADGSYNYDYLFANVKDSIQAADMAVVNEEVIKEVYKIECDIDNDPQSNKPRIHPIRTIKNQALVC